MAKRLKENVHVSDETHSTVVFVADTPKSELPDWAKAKVGDHAYYDDDSVSEEDSNPAVVVPFGAPQPAGEGVSSTIAEPGVADAEPKAKTTKSAKGADSK